MFSHSVPHSVASIAPRSSIGYTSPPAVVTGAAPSSFAISSHAPAVRSLSPLRSASVFTGLRECRNTSAVRMNSTVE